jgi:hypothetical protein
MPYRPQRVKAIIEIGITNYSFVEQNQWLIDKFKHTLDTLQFACLNISYQETSVRTLIDIYKWVF